MQNTFSFNFTNPVRNTNDTERSFNNNTKRTPSPRQISYYLDLCTQRKIAPKNYHTMTGDELAQEIEAVRSFYPASDRQKEIIRDTITSLQEMGVNINLMSDEDMAKLTGGREGTASALIENLINMQRQHSDKQPPSDNQLQFLVSMFLCPDVPFEDFGVMRKITLNDEGLWRKPTPDEFAEDLKKKMTRKEASKFIDDYRGSFHTWRSTRIRPEQMRYIRQLEERMSDLSSPNVVEWAVNPDGSLVQVMKQRTLKEEYNPTGYVPLDEMELMMFSVEEASKYIDILKSEGGRKDLYKYREESDNSATFEPIHTPETKEKRMEMDYKELQDLIFRLEAVAGYENEDVHKAVTFLLVQEDVDSDAINDSKEIIRDFMKYLIEEDYIGLEGMAELCKNCKTAQLILMGK